MMSHLSFFVMITDFVFMKFLIEIKVQLGIICDPHLSPFVMITDSVFMNF